MSISIDSLLDVDVRYSGDKKGLVPMLGSLEVAKSWILKQMNTESDPIRDKEDEKLDKGSAITKLLKQRKVIEQRLDIIAKSDKRAEFVVKDI